jgi:hypothetical protein
MLQMHRRIVWMIIGIPLTLVVIGGGAALSIPTVRHLVWGLWNIPDRLPALAGNNQVHYQTGAEDYARDAAVLLPDAITLAGRVNLSPKLFWPQHQRLRAILIHELSHAHLQGWIGANAYIHLPNWFKEGLAVMASEGGGAELVSEDEARAAIRRGEQLVVDSAGSLQNLVDVRLEKAPAGKPPWYPVVLAYREAGIFVSYLQESDRPAFDRMMNAILDSRAFAEAVTFGYHDDVRSLWQKFIESRTDRK